MCGFFGRKVLFSSIRIRCVMKWNCIVVFRYLVVIFGLNGVGGFVGVLVFVVYVIYGVFGLLVVGVVLVKIVVVVLVWFVVYSMVVCVLMY